MAKSSVKAGNAYVEIGLKNRIARGAAGVQKDIRNLSNKIRANGTSLAKIGGTIAAATAGPFAMIIRQASEMQETMGKFGVVFGDSADSMKEWSDSTAAAMGVSEQSMASMLSGMQDLLVPMGVLPDSAAGMSKELSTLAVDLASFNNMDSAKTFEDLMAAMTGSGEVMKKYGVILSETAVKQELANMGLDPKNADNAAKAQARLNIIMRGTTAAQGDAIRTSGSFANQMKALWALTKDTAAALGGPLLDDLAGVLQLVNAGIGSIKNFVKENEGLMRMVGLAAVAIGGIGTALVAIGGAAAIAGVAFGGLATAIGVVMSPLALTIGGVAALGFAFVHYTDMGAQAIDWLKERFGPLVSTVQGAIGAIMEALRTGDLSLAWELTVETLELVWLDMTEGIRSAWSTALGWILDAGSTTAEAIGQVFQGLATALGAMLDAYKSYYNKVFNFVTEKIGEANGVRTIGGQTDAFSGQFGGVESQVRTAIDNVRNFGEGMENEAAAQKVRRAEERERAKAERQARRDELTVNLSEAAKQAEVSKEERMEREKRLKDQIKVEAAEIKAADLGGASQRTGPSATFSAFAAGLIGGGPTGVAVSDPKQLKATEETNKKLDILISQNKKKPVAAFG